MTQSWHESLVSCLDNLPRRRQLRPALPGPNGMIEVAGRTLVDFSSNDYLGLAHDPRLAAARQVSGAASGATASRLLSGNHPVHDSIERKTARLKQSPAALLMNSGFTTNSTVLAALLDSRLQRPGRPAVQVFVDRLVHASIHFGLAAAGVRQRRFRHNDLNHLKQLLEASGDESARRLIVTESVFSMDGDIADLPGLRRLADRFDALLYIDEAHATGVLGPGGAGLAVAAGGDPLMRREIVVGTFGKALGSLGAYVASSPEVREYLINRCSGLIYATALPPPVLFAIDAALDLLPDLDSQRAGLHQMAGQFRTRLNQSGIDTAGSSTHIVPVIIGDDQKTMQVAGELMDAGFLTGAIRPPTVPEGTARLRVSLSAAHRPDQVSALADAIVQVLRCQMIA